MRKILIGRYLPTRSNRGKTLTPKNEERFYRTGDSAIHLLKMFEHRNKVNLSRGVCFELGCGVGRLTRNLAANFDHVIAVDISPGNLAIAKKRFNQDGIKNVEFWLIKDFSDFDKLPDFDVFYSMIVLQHNTPPLQKAILSSVLPKCKSGTLFQTATNLIEYRFVAEEYLTYPDEGMEVHPLPQYSVNELLRSTGLKLHETLPDTFIGTYGSNTFFASR